jgi:hypothetical protein
LGNNRVVERAIIDKFSRIGNDVHMLTARDTPRRRRRTTSSVTAVWPPQGSVPRDDTMI